jgi:hypothetical protein
MEEGHYHVDVCAGPEEAFVRGFTLIAQGEGQWVVYDEIGLAGMPGPLSGPLSLADALRQALAQLYAVIERRPLAPIWGGAPLEMLGYAKGSLAQRLLRHAEPVYIGPDGLPEPQQKTD